MTVLTMPAQPAAQDTPALRPVPWRRMAWVTWRQHRATLISVTAVVAALAVFLLIAGADIHHNYALLLACTSQCGNLNAHFNETDWHLANGMNIVMNVGAALLGAFAGAPLLAREIETGTYRFAWTQAFGRERWAIAQLVGIGAAIAVLAWALSQVFDWFFAPMVPQEDMTILTVFETHGIVFAFWALAAFAIGACAGMLVRRIVPAMAVTLGAYLLLALAAWDVRKYYPVAIVASVPSTPSTSTGGGPIPFSMNDPWVLNTWTTGTTNWEKYIPVSRFWPMQLIESGWLLVLSAALIAATVWLVHRRAV
jgi:hypothetical protein